MWAGRNPPNFDDIRSSEDALYGILRQLEAIVLHFSSDYGTSLGVQLGPPLRGASGTRGLGVELVQGPQRHKLRRGFGRCSWKERLHLSSDGNSKIVILVDAQVEYAVAIPAASEGLPVLGISEGVGALEFDRRLLVDGLE